MGEKKLKVLFIGGAGRSGSTLLDLLLGEMPGFFSLGELDYIWERGFLEDQPCGCGRAFGSCGFWRSVIQHGCNVSSAEANFKLQRSTARLRYTPQLLFSPVRTRKFRARLEKQISVMEGLFAAIQEISGAKIVVDSSKRLPHGLILAELRNVDLYVLHLVRDSRAVAYSWKRRKSRVDSNRRDSYMPIHGTVRSGFNWSIANIIGERLRTRAKRYVRVNYERMVTNPKETLTVALQKLAMVENPRVLVENLFCEPGVVPLNATHHTIWGNPIRANRDEINIKIDKEWIVSMPLLDRAAVTFITWPLLLHYGYFNSLLSCGATKLDIKKAGPNGDPR